MYEEKVKSENRPQEKQINRLRPECLSCTCEKYLEKYPDNISKAEKVEYMQKVMALMANLPMTAAVPVVVREIDRLRVKMFGKGDDYAAIKKHFNAVMMEKVPRFKQQIASADDPIKMALQLSMIGNYIDFGVMKEVDEDKLNALLDQAVEKEIEEETYQQLRKDLAKSKKLLFLTDNCGEIVLDKLLLEEIKMWYPKLSVTVMVRGGETLNDATREDAGQVGMAEVAEVVDNGNDIAGTWLPEMAEEARAIFEEADVMIAKGQANFETLRCCGKNIYYLFLCKCHIFSDMFAVEPFSGMLVNDRDARNREESSRIKAAERRRK